MLDGFQFLPNYLDRQAQEDLVETTRNHMKNNHFYTPRMPRSNKPFTVKMTNFGELGWISDATGYRYDKQHPETKKPWPSIPRALMSIWESVSQYPKPPQACLVNYYDENAKMGLHCDGDEEDINAPVVSISLGDSARFRLGGLNRRDPTKSFKLNSGDVIILGGQARLAYHGIDRIYGGSSTLLKNGGRLNLTLRRIDI
ncbi:alpha-ketoglutarate-dependent dioxygenase AlkB [Hirschia baltica]|uniref:2OG-Fe(II) oxygenase n=1 Tax=Hirschia baltica (strain ATCC 49814 / DSM 5838 / IFAM 1418) TaxID=582402 RepID=C6XII7_HIRBI|nr:alpha-ketoglutarate-dependent dioxygenase AlkB [Hirschia baltica]ACT60794.1 2OG-Fe(II) oxygenase [Hirschia baltica ATCC 49814]